ncbi:MAG: alpha-glucosidase, partial [Alphaproteobacteria bacterium]|nr:alpha-glucosidase [Alphaproteobacteria bacterium]
MTAGAPWWRGAVIYQVYVRSFADGNGDGQGDFSGLRSKLGYLAGLGVDAIWLSPVHPSPNRDWGYDVSDFDGV